MEIEGEFIRMNTEAVDHVKNRISAVQENIIWICSYQPEIYLSW